MDRIIERLKHEWGYYGKPKQWQEGFDAGMKEIDSPRREIEKITQRGTDYLLTCVEQQETIDTLRKQIDDIKKIAVELARRESLSWIGEISGQGETMYGCINCQSDYVESKEEIVHKESCLTVRVNKFLNENETNEPTSHEINSVSLTERIK